MKIFDRILIVCFIFIATILEILGVYLHELLFEIRAIGFISLAILLMLLDNK